MTCKWNCLGSVRLQPTARGSALAPEGLLYHQTYMFEFGTVPGLPMSGALRFTQRPTPMSFSLDEAPSSERATEQ